MLPIRLRDVRLVASASGADNTAIVQSGTQNVGTGTYTVMAQVAAETLGVPIAAVRLELGDTRFPPAPVSGGSSMVPSIAPAVRAACEAARAQPFRMARSNAQLGCRTCRRTRCTWKMAI